MEKAAEQGLDTELNKAEEIIVKLNIKTQKRRRKNLTK